MSHTPAHFAVFVTHTCAASEGPQFVVVFMCQREPAYSDTITTLWDDVSCPDCLARAQKRPQPGPVNRDRAHLALPQPPYTHVPTTRTSLVGTIEVVETVCGIKALPTSPRLEREPGKATCPRCFAHPGAQLI